MSVVEEAGAGVLMIRGVRLHGSGEKVDLTIRDGAIDSVDTSTSTDGSELIALPGFVDLHTHLREPGGEHAETIESGTRAAAAGGYTDVFAMANTSPTTDSVERVAELRRRAGNAFARVHFNSAVTKGLGGTALVDIEGLRKIGVHVFSDDGHCVDDDGLVLRTLTALSRLGGVFAQHAQSRSIVGAGVINANVATAVGCEGWPPVGEEAVVARDIAIARATGGHLHVCHVSTRGTVDLLRWAKSVGAPVTAEVTPHHLLLTDSDAVERGPALKVNPPLRDPDDVMAVREGLADGTIDAVATDHAPHPADTKQKGWPDSAFGLTALETALAVTAEALTSSGRVDWPRLIEVMSRNPARIGGLDATNRQILPGSPADICVVEAGGPWAARPRFSLSSNSPFNGSAFGHRVVSTVLDGRLTHSLD